jgi:serine protease
MQTTGLPPIDRGLRSQDPPREPRGGQGDRNGAGAGSQSTYLPGSVIVKYANRDSFEILDIPSTADAEAAAETLRSRSDVEYAQPRYFNHAMQVHPNDPMYSSQWNLPAIGMETAWTIQPGASSDIIVAVLDSGMAFKTVSFRYTRNTPFRDGITVYPALGSVLIPFAAAPELGQSDSSRFVSPQDFIWGDEFPVDLDGHGTHVAGTIGQLTNNGIGVAGMAYNVRLMPLKVIAGFWDEYFCPLCPGGTDDVVATAIRYAADNGAKVINMSIGRTSGGPAPAIRDAIRYAVSRGVFVAVAAGNTRDSGNAPSRVAEFAPSIDGMVAVAAVGKSLDLAYYSTTGSYVEIAAPGGDQRQLGQGGTTAGIVQQTIDPDLLETYNRPLSQFGPPRADAFAFEFFQGTSMATPHVSGFAALLMQQGITSPAAIEAAMEKYATPKGAPGRDDQYGYGLINPRATLRGLGLAR